MQPHYTPNSNPIPSTSGIYRITCTISKKPYIGSAVNLRQRHTNHFSMLRCNSHHSISLQRAWNKYGEDAFTFEVLELALIPFLIEREQHWLDKLKPFGRKGYNILPAAGSRLGSTHSPESRAKMSQSRMGNTNRAGKMASPETRAKLSAAGLGKKHTPEHIEKVRQANLGKKASPEHIEKMRQGRTNTKTLIVTAPDGTEHIIYGIRQFCKEHGLNRSNFMHVAKGKKSSHKGWKARYLDHHQGLTSMVSP